MRISAFRIFPFAMLGIELALSASGQISASGSAQASGSQVSGDNSARFHSQPYTAEFKITQVQTLADGTTITRESTEVSARDSSGRTFSQTTNSGPNGLTGALGFVSGHVQNPAEGIQIMWGSSTKRAQVIKMPVGEQRHGCWKSDTGTMTMSFDPGSRPASPAVAAAAGTGQPGIVLATTGAGSMVPTKPEIEDLGTATIQGIEAHGHRYTTTTPLGAIGNDRPIVRTSESWMAKELGLLVRQVENDPRTGTRTRELVNLTTGEPDPVLFEPPEGYTVTTEEMRQVPCDQK